MISRRVTQVVGTLAANPWFYYLKSRTIYQGRAKGFCIPVLNCYACPLAMYSCPIGALQHSVATWSAGAFLYVAGFLAVVGAVIGRMTCGWICPFGLLQDLLYRVPLPKFRLPGWARFGKYATLVVLVLLVTGITGVHWFSRLCPAGALEGGLPLRLIPPSGVTITTGWFFWMKMGILSVFLLWMMVTKRPFCRAACPLGAIFALFNPLSLYRMEVDLETCKDCKKCRQVCPVDIQISENPDSPECIRCLECKKACPLGVVSSGFRRAGPAGAGKSAAEG